MKLKIIGVIILLLIITLSGCTENRNDGYQYHLPYDTNPSPQPIDWHIVHSFTQQIYMANDFNTFYIPSSCRQWMITWTPINNHQVPFTGTLYNGNWKGPPISPNNIFDSIYSSTGAGSKVYRNIDDKTLTMCSGFYYNEITGSTQANYYGLWEITISYR